MITDEEKESLLKLIEGDEVPHQLQCIEKKIEDASSRGVKRIVFQLPVSGDLTGIIIHKLERRNFHVERLNDFIIQINWR